MGPASRAAASSSSASVGNASRKNHRSKSSNNNSGGNNNASVRNTAEMTDVEYLDYIGNYKPGTLRTIKLTNFLTHKDVVIRPGPRLNVVCGANGTGKSTILNAICLGLGGEPKVLGRADDVRDFIMHNEEVATIEIELTPHPGKETHVLKRIMDRRKGSDKGRGRGSSTFYINDTKVNIKEVQELVRDTYAIAIENMCTFLPQDKVGGFSALTPQELLVETEKVLDKDGRYIRTHMGLIEAQNNIQSGASDVEAIKSKLKKLQHENEQLERAKDLLEERNRAIHQLDLLQKKQLWLQFEALRERALELKNQKAKLKEQLEEAQKSLEPLQEQLEAAAQRVKTMEAKERLLRDKVQSAMKESERHEKKFQSHDDKIEEGTLELQAMDDRRAQAEERVRECQEKADADKANSDRLPPREQYVKERDDANAAKRNASQEYGEAKKAVRELQGQLRDVEDRAKVAQSAVARLSDASAQRRSAVFRKFRELERINSWIETNRGQFRRPVVGPIAAEITPSTAEAAAFIEQHIPNATLKAYCVETREDRDLLYNEIRGKMGIPINILILRKSGRSPRYYSTNKMRELQRYGVHGYLDELFTAPDIVMQAVIESSMIDRVLVGDSTTYDNISAVKDIVSAAEAGSGNGGLKSFVICCSASHGPANGGGATNLFKFQGTKSRYANQISLRQDDVLASKCISPGVDPSELKAAEAQLASAHEEVAAFRPRMAEAEKTMRERESILQECHADLEVATARLTGHVKMEQKLQNSLRKLKEAKAAVESDDSDEKKALAESIMNRLRNAISALDARSQQISVLVQATADGLGVNANKSLWNTEQRLAEMALSDKKRHYDTLEAEVRRANDEYKRARADCAAKNKVATREAPIVDENNEDLPLRQELENLGKDTLDEVEVAIEECEAKANSIVANPDVIRQYEARKREIEQLESTVEQMVQEEADKTKLLDHKRRMWENGLQEQIEVMNGLFSKYMSDMGNVGALELYRGEPTAENGTGQWGYGSFKDWGIKIRVGFRGSEKAQVLSAQSHSGGERAVSTIMYLMAAQDMLVSPFRCVDEINQGLDERNERLVFSRIVANSCRRPDGDDPTDHSGQYFLITPKLLPNLEDMANPGIQPLIVLNGAFNHLRELDVDYLVELLTKKKTTSKNKRSSVERDDAGNADEGDDVDCENSGNSSSRGVAASSGARRRVGGSKKSRVAANDDDEGLDD